MANIRLPLAPVPLTVGPDGQGRECLMSSQSGQAFGGQHTEGTWRNGCHHLGKEGDTNCMNQCEDQSTLLLCVDTHSPTHLPARLVVRVKLF